MNHVNKKQEARGSSKEDAAVSALVAQAAIKEQREFEELERRYTEDDLADASNEAFGRGYEAGYQEGARAAAEVYQEV